MIYGTHLARIAGLLLLPLALLLAVAASPQEQGSNVSAAEARRIIAEGNMAWGRARVALDRAHFDKMLAPDFYVQFPERRLTRQEFIDMISTAAPGAKLVRFDATVLTVQPSKDGWVAVIHEKLESEFTGADGKTQKAYALWITRDGWRKTGDRWFITFSEAIGNESWRGGARPPFRDW